MSDFATDKEIRYAEKMLFGKSSVFNVDKIRIIKENSTCDVKACPGSGKTTTLLAKLIILSNRLPFKSGRGICVLTHTNVAIDEIKKSLGGKSSALFTYPNFFGTIQTFVDTYLSNGALHHYYETGIKTVDDDKAYVALTTEWRGKRIDYSKLGSYLYFKFADRYKKLKENEFTPIDFQTLIKNNLVRKEKKTYELEIANLKNAYLKVLTRPLKDHVCRLKEQIIKKVNKEKDEFRRVTYIDFVSDTKPKIRSNLGNVLSLESESGKLCLQLKENVFKQGILSFKDSYHLALRYLKDYPQLKDAISKRFKYLFLDEMQDTDDLQNFFLKNAFDEKLTTIQRFGDPNQAIYDSISLNSKNNWNPEKTLPIDSSLRFGENIANVLRTICVADNNNLLGNENIKSFKPIIILYKNPLEVLPKFYELVQEKKIGEDSLLEIARKKATLEDGVPKIKAIGWIKEAKNDSNLGIRSYFPQFETSSTYIEKSFNLFVDYISIRNDFTLSDISSQITDALLRLLHIAGKKSVTGRDFTKTSLFNQFEDCCINEDYKTNKAIWCLSLSNETQNIDGIVEDIKTWVIERMNPCFNIELGQIETFFAIPEQLKEIKIGQNNIRYKEDIEVSTVHGVKGETHIATLYLETSFHDKCESERIEDQIKGVPFTKCDGDTYIKQTLKVAYVGMSRPQYLLCFAIKKGHLSDDTLNSQEFKERWNVIEI
jgi:hypothetical protein